MFCLHQHTHKPTHYLFLSPDKTICQIWPTTHNYGSNLALCLKKTKTNKKRLELNHTCRKPGRNASFWTLIISHSCWSVGGTAVGDRQLCSVGCGADREWSETGSELICRINEGDMWGVNGHDSKWPHPHPGEQFIDCWLSATERTEIWETSQCLQLGIKAETSIALKEQFFFFSPSVYISYSLVSFLNCVLFSDTCPSTEE